MNKVLARFTVGILLSGMSLAFADVRSPAESLPFGQSLAVVSEYFLNRPFVDNPLGEGPGTYDSDPLYRTDAFDCTTFVETVWAVSHSQANDWRTNLQRIRYRDGKISFVNRLHFISHDWLPYQEGRGAIVDLTGDLAPKGSLGKVVTHIDRRAWFKRMHPKELAAFNAAFPTEEAADISVPYISMDSVLDDPGIRENLRTELRKGALLVNFVRGNWKMARFIGTDLDISHQGFIVLKGDRIVLRHASAYHKKAIETDFLAYLNAQRLHPSLKGLQILRIAD